MTPSQLLLWDSYPSLHTLSGRPTVTQAACDWVVSDELSVMPTLIVHVPVGGKVGVDINIAIP